jgi:uncharacterized protein (TIGR02217 family)
MSFYDFRLSPCVEQGFQGGPEWSTTIVSNAGDYEMRVANWSMPHYKFQASFNQFEPADQDEICAAFLAMRGPVHSFRFKDWRDFKLISEPLGTGDGTSTPRQITKYYTFGPATYARAIRLPIEESLVVLAGVTPIGVSIDSDGMATPDAPWPNGQILTVSGEFDVRVRFGSDYYPFTMPENNLSRVSIDLKEALTP